MLCSNVPLLNSLSAKKKEKKKKRCFPEAILKSTNFLVLFDDDLQKVVNRSKILTDGRVRVNDRYTVIWGNTDQADEAKIIATGEWIDLTRKMNTGITSPPRKRKAQDSSENRKMNVHQNSYDWLDHKRNC